MPNGGMLYFASDATIRQYLEVLLKEIKVQKGYRKGDKG
jgi:hypothetical protein